MDDGETGRPHGRPQCTATAKSTGARCKNAPAPFATVCRFHGSRAPQVMRKAAERAVLAEAAAILDRWQPPGGDSGPVDIGAELARLISLQTSMRDYLTGRIAAVEPAAWADPETFAMVRLWQQANDQVGRLLTDLARLGIDLNRTEATRRAYAVLVYLLPRLSAQFGIPCSRGDEIGDVIAEEIRGIPDAVWDHL